jgi:hypothetical protein
VLEAAEVDGRPAAAAERAVEATVGVVAEHAEVPARPPVLELAGRDHLAVRLERHVLGAARQVVVLTGTHLERPDPARAAAEPWVEVARGGGGGRRQAGQREQRRGEQLHVR